MASNFTFVCLQKVLWLSCEQRETEVEKRKNIFILHLLIIGTPWEYTTPERLLSLQEGKIETKTAQSVRLCDRGEHNVSANPAGAHHSRKLRINTTNRKCISMSKNEIKLHPKVWSFSLYCRLRSFETTMHSTGRRLHQRASGWRQVHAVFAHWSHNFDDQFFCHAAPLRIKSGASFLSPGFFLWMQSSNGFWTH